MVHYFAIQTPTALITVMSGPPIREPGIIWFTAPVTGRKVYYAPAQYVRELTLEEYKQAFAEAARRSRQ
jgi:hypothetical protein